MTSRFELLEGIRRRGAAELGRLVKTADVRVALCYPNSYHVGMSSLGYQTIYRCIHAHPAATAERVFLPDDMEAWRKARLTPVSEETLTPLDAFPVLAFSMAYELELPGFFTLLSAAGLSALRENRHASPHPLVLAGGPLTFSNPTPLEPFVDVLLQGEAEDLVPILLDALQTGMEKRALLEALAPLPGFLVPELSPATRRFFVAKASEKQLPAFSQILTPHTELKDMFLIEAERGCSRQCHYCVMRGSTNGGMRTVSINRVLEFIPPQARRVGLVGAAVTDHPRILELLEAIVHSGREVGVSSLRADRLTQPLVNALKAGGARVLTVAADGASQRMRNLVQRRHSEEQIFLAASMAKAAGINRLKVYVMIGLPYETDADIDELLRFVGQLSKVLPIALGVAPFIAKRNTPLDGAPFAGIDVLNERLSRLRRGLKGRVDIRPTSPRWAWVEYMLAQCGTQAGLAAFEAWRLGGGRFRAWQEAFTARGCQPYEMRRTPHRRLEAVPWPSVGTASMSPASGSMSERDAHL